MVADISDWSSGGAIGPNQPPLFAVYQLAAGAIQNLIAPVAGISIVLYGAIITMNAPAGSFIALQTTNNATILQYGTLSVGPKDMALYGVKLGLGLGLQVQNVSPTAMTQSDYITLFYGTG